VMDQIQDPRRRRFSITIVLVALLFASVTGSPDASARVYDFIETDQVDFDFATRKGLRLRFTNPDIALRVGGRLHGDIGFIEDDRTNAQKFKDDLRRARLYMTGKIYKNIKFKIDREFASERRGWRNLYLGYRFGKGFAVKGGNVVAPFGLEDMAASNYSTFMERSVSATLAPSFQTGVLLKTNGRFGSKGSRHRWTAAAAWMTEPLGESSNDRHQTEHYSVVSRLTYAPIARKRRMIHFGGAVEYRHIRDDRRYRTATRPESSLMPRLLDTGALADVESVVSVGLEGAAIYGPLTFQAEYMRSFLQRSGGRADPSFDGGYAQLSYVLTGEHRKYSRSSALIGGLKPKSRWGAVEVGLRFSSLDLNDETVDGGSARDWTVGLNWYVRENMRLMFNYIAIDARLGSTRQSDSPHVGQVRFQLFF
jgi:phosphate-selective porin OprO/OprP